MNLYQASNQWAHRPDDERFASLSELRAACHGYYESAVDTETTSKRLMVKPDGQELSLIGDHGASRFTHYAFGQFCNRLPFSDSQGGTATAPASYLRVLPPELAALNLNYSLMASPEQKFRVLSHRNNGDSIVRAATSDIYERIWNWQVADWCQNLPSGWRTPPALPARAGQAGTRPATAEDILNDKGFGLSVNIGDAIAPAGLYASDHDLFVFMVNEDRQVGGGKEPMSRGFFATNSEVGAASLRFTLFLYSHVCGNHIVWGAKDVAEIRIRHVGELAGRKAVEAVKVVREFADAQASEDEILIQKARTKELGPAKPEVVNLITDKLGLLSKKRAEEAYVLAEQYADIHGSPRSAWGYAAGITRLSQTMPYADQRDVMDRTARKVIELAL